MNDFTINWQSWMSVAYLHLGVGPEDFWRLTPCELMSLLKPPGAAVAISRGDLQAMQEQYPD